MSFTFTFTSTLTQPQELTGKRLAVLGWVVRRMAAEPQSAFYRRDASGAYPLHALLVANTKASIQLALRIMELRPDLITQAHGAGRFAGENALHILAVNRRYEDFERLVHLACSLLDDDCLRELLFTQAEGKFFADPCARAAPAAAATRP